MLSRVSLINARRGLLSLGIRREDKNRWERRVPLCPERIEKLVNEYGVKVFVQPSTRRVFPDVKFQEAGAIITEDLSPADVIIGVKEVPMKHLLPNKTYMFFSHTHKGQSYNMTMLKDILDKKIRLVDYELLQDENKKRLVLFSKFAGYAGTIDGMHGLGQRLLALGYGNPFISIGMSYMYRCLPDARLDVTRTGQVIMDDGLPKALGPLTFVFTGFGNVTKGALHVFKCLPHEFVKPSELKDLVNQKDFNNNKVYGCIVQTADHIRRKDGKPFDPAFYASNPQDHYSIFADEIAPYTSMLINGILWNPNQPRLITKEQIKNLYEANKLRLQTVADISCDIDGSLEFMSRASTIADPFFMYDPVTGQEHDNFEGRGVQIMSVDNLPAEMPLEASEYFSNSLFPHIVQMLKENWEHPVIKRASITLPDGSLAPSHRGLAKNIERHAIKVTRNSKVLLLGSGYVSSPVVDYLLRDKKNAVTIASDSLRDAEKVSNQRQRAPATQLNINDKQALAKAIKDHDLVVSLIPAPLHPQVAKVCIQEKKNLVTASYTSPEMAALSSQAESAGIVLLNELGLDPGIDHMVAMQTFDAARREGKQILRYTSWCGGLPAPECSDNPLGYKFSWSPRGVLLAATNSAKYLENGTIVDIKSNELLKSAVDVPIYKGFALEGYANRDSLKYQSMYKLENVKTLFRGTLRYKRYSELMAAFKDIGLLNTLPDPAIQQGSLTWKGLVKKILGIKRDDDVFNAVSARMNGVDPEKVMDALHWFDLLSDKPVQIANGAQSTVLDAFCFVLMDKLKFGPGERDMVVMSNIFEFLAPDGRTTERLTSTLTTYGDVGGYSAMAKTVGLPAAMGAELILNGKVNRKGCIAPITADIYEPILENLGKEGILFRHELKQLKRGF